MGTFSKTFGVCLAQQGTKLNQDSDANAFIAAAGISDANTKNAITTFVKDLKAINAVQSDFVNFTTPANSVIKALYPFVGSYGDNRLNLINPANTDAAFRLSTTPTGITQYGVKLANGTHGYLNANTLNADSHSIGFYCTEEFNNTSPNIEMGVTYTTLCIGAASAGRTIYYATAGVSSGGKFVDKSTNAFFQLNKTSSAIGGVKVLRNNKSIFTNTALSSGTMPDGYIKLMGCLNSSNRRLGLSYISGGISNSANELFFNAIKKYQYNMGRIRLFNFIIEGHSFTVINGAWDSFLYKKLKINNTVIPLDEYTISSGGETIATITSRISTLNSYMELNQTPPFINHMVLWIGINDFLSGTRTGEQVYADLKTYVQTQLNNGYSKIYVFTTLKTTNPTYDSKIDTLNGLINSDLVNLTGVSIINAHLVPELSNPANTTYFRVDGLHLNATGNAIAVDLMVDAIEAA